MYRVVLDPGVLIAALLSGSGAPARILLAWMEGVFELVVSPKLLSELKAVLLRPKFRPYVAVEEAEAYVSLLERRASTVTDPQPIGGLTPDRNDDYLVNLARAAGAHFLVSGDTHLTGLRRSRPPVLDPRAFLSVLEKNERPEGA